MENDINVAVISQNRAPQLERSSRLISSSFIHSHDGNQSGITVQQ